jgi:hypothetical protein
MKLNKSEKINNIKTIIFICLAVLFFILPVFSQNQRLKPTYKITESELLKKANAHITKKEYEKAVLLLKENYSNFSESLSVNWIYAHVSYLFKNPKEAEKKFKKAMSLSPLDKHLQMDYARFLYQTGQIKTLKSMISLFMNDDSKDAEFLLIQANLSFWEGDIKNAQNKITRILELYPKTDITKDLSDQINQLLAVYVKTNIEYQTDSQPLNFIAYHANIEKYSSTLLNPKLEISNYSFSPEKEGALTVKLSNRFNFNKLKLTANLTSGLYKNFIGQDDWLASLSFGKKVTKNILFNFGYAKSNLLSTIASTKINLTQEDIFANLNFTNKWIVFQGGYNYKYFKDNNTIKTIYSYILSQPIKIRNINFQFGYSYNFTNSKDVLFVFDSKGFGVYDPYFTPKEQQINEGLFIINYKPTNKLTFEAKVNYGFNATVRNPYRIQRSPTEFEIGGFYDETFTPIELSSSMNYIFSNRFSAKFSYIDQETFFYRRKNTNLGLNFTF